MCWALRTRMRRLVVPSILLALAGCSAGGPSSAGPSTKVATSVSPSISSSSSPQTFESSRHGYRVEVPPRWHVVQYEGTWTKLDQFGPGIEVPGEDVVSPLDLSSFLVVNSMKIPKGMTAAGWQAAFDALVAAGADPNCPGTARTDVLAGEPAKVLEQHCEGSVLIGRSLTHAGRGYYFTIRFPANDAATKATLDGIVASIQFTSP